MKLCAWRSRIPASRFSNGPLGTELGHRGVSLAGIAWCANALDTAPETVRAIHRDYAQAGATVHTLNTFRATQRASGGGWKTASEYVEHVRTWIAAGATVIGGCCGTSPDHIAALAEL